MNKLVNDFSMRYVYTAFCLFFSLVSFGQRASLPMQYKFRVYLSDKGETGYSLQEPDRFLSERAIERKKRQQVMIDAADFPISRDYFTLMEEAGAKVVSHSKWLKTVTVQVEDSQKIKQIASLPFVDSVKYVWQGHSRSYRSMVRPRLSRIDCHDQAASGDIFGITGAQFLMHRADKLVKAGFQGKGMTVGVIDAGFTNFDVIPWFETVRLREVMNFVPGGEILAASDHGTKVVSTMAANLPGVMMGSAAEASYWLLRSEDTTSEFPVEEDYWVRAIEYADSLGLDVINTSLGYYHFDDTLLNYTHADLTGTVSLMSLAADMAYDKGMLVVVSAGNEGNKPWQKSTPPGDARNVLAVGAVGTDSLIASFSSRGQMADGRLKPDLVSVGNATITIGQEGSIGMTNGTSLSSPFLAGLATSLWSINPDLHRARLIQVIKESSNRYSRPDSVYGHGIPDFQQAMKKVLETLAVHPQMVEEDGWSIRPDGATHYRVTLLVPEYSADAYSFRLLDESGNVISAHTFGENESTLVPLPAVVRKNNRFIHFVTDDPLTQRTYRIKL